ncbi:MAG: hypothetical protein AAFQ20_03370, partial [Bacteroidota bacterium]
PKLVLFENRKAYAQALKRVGIASIGKNNLQHHSDWIVLCQTMETLGKWSKKDDALKIWIRPELERLHQDDRKSVSKKAEKWLKALA